MFEIECPQCKSPIGFGLTDFFQQRIEKRECPSCGVGLELSNPALFFVFNGLIFGGLVMVLGCWGLQSEWLKVIIVAPLCWLIAPVIVQILGRWRVCSYEPEDTINARRWSRAGCISGWIFGGAVAMTAITLALHLREFVFSANDFVMGGDSDGFEKFEFGLKFHVLPGIAVAVIALAVTIVARLKTKRLRGVDEELYN